MHVGQMVHFFWRGRCNAAVITQFWDDDDSVASLTSFEPQGSGQYRRVKKGQRGEDITFHTLEECPDVDMGKAAATAEPEPEATPEPTPITPAKPVTGEAPSGKAKAGRKTSAQST